LHTGSPRKLHTAAGRQRRRTAASLRSSCWRGGCSVRSCSSTPRRCGAHTSLAATPTYGTRARRGRRGL